MLYSDYIGPVRLRLNLPELAFELKRVWHPCPKPNPNLDRSPNPNPTLAHLGQLSRQLLQPPVGSNTYVGETQTRYESVATLNWLNQY